MKSAPVDKSQKRAYDPSVSYLQRLGIPACQDPIKLGCPKEFHWRTQTGIQDDVCQIAKRNQESVGPGCHNLTSSDPRRQDCREYSKRMSVPMNFQKQLYNTLHYADCDSQLIQSPLTNLRTIHQLFTRPYVGYFAGPGRPDGRVVDAESFLWQGYTTLEKKACEPTSGQDVTSYAFNYLPCFGNPQRIDHVIEPPISQGGWIRGGICSRDMIRQLGNRCIRKPADFEYPCNPIIMDC